LIAQLHLGVVPVAISASWTTQEWEQQLPIEEKSQLVITLLCTELLNYDLWFWTGNADSKPRRTRKDRTTDRMRSRLRIHTNSTDEVQKWFPEEKASSSEFHPLRQTPLTSQKTLLLGTGEQGKRTFFCACDHLVHRTYDAPERRRQWSSSMQQSIWLTIQMVPLLIDRSGLSLSFKPENQVFIDSLRAYNDGGIDEEKFFDLNCWRMSVKLLEDPAMKALTRFKYFNQIQILEYMFFEVLPRLDSFSALFDPSQTFVPEFQDVLRCRLRVTGISESRVDVDGISALLVLVGGQRNERKKWIHSYDGVNNILFFIALDDFGKVLFEDNTTSRMLENLNLFDHIVGNGFFFGLEGINVVLTRGDMMRRKIEDGVFPGVDEYSGIEYGFTLDPNVQRRANPQEIERKWVEFIQKKVKSIGQAQKKRIRIFGPTYLFEPQNCLDILKKSLMPFSVEDEYDIIPGDRVAFRAGLFE
jgi:hypothetical protein